MRSRKGRRRSRFARRKGRGASRKRFSRRGTRRDIVSTTSGTRGQGFGRSKHSKQIRDAIAIVKDTETSWYVNRAAYTCGVLHNGCNGSATSPTGNIYGAQAYAVVGSIFSPFDLLQCSGVSDNTVGTLTYNRQFVVRNCTTELTWKNNSTSACYLDLYMCVARRDIPNTLTTTTTTGPAYCLEQLFADGIGSQGNLPNQYGMTPFQSNAFVEQIKILKKTTDLVQPGGSGSRINRFTRLRMFNTNRIGYKFAQAASTTSPALIDVVIKGTVFWFAITRGTPAGNPASNVTADTHNIDFVFLERSDVRYAVNATQRTSIQGSLSTSAAVELEEYAPSAGGVTSAVF